LQLGVWDPLGLIEDGNVERFEILQEYELKHGRVAMLAVVGYLTTAAGIRFPGAEGIPDGLASFPALIESKDGNNVLFQMLAFFTVAEIVNREATWVPGVKAEFPGDYRNNALDFGWDKFDAATKKKKRTIELNNGRAAMMGIWGLVTHELMGNSILPGGYLPGQV
jgi:Chlorophyll A-B binding protein